MSSLPVPLHTRAEEQRIIATSPGPAGRTQLPVANSTKSFWFTDPDVRPSPNEGSEGPLTDDADICIVGSGMTGVSAAYHFAKAFAKEDGVAASLKRPVRAVILEAREFCSGATGRNGGHLTAYRYQGFKKQQEKWGTAEALRALAIERHTVDEVVKVLNENGKEDYVDLTRGGRLSLIFSEEELAEIKDNIEAAKTAGADMTDVHLLTKEQVQSEYGASYPAVLTPGNNFWPLKVVSVLFNLANDLSPNFSVKLHTQTPVTAVSPLPHIDTFPGTFPRRQQLRTPRGSITCSYVIHATNAYVSHLLPHLSGPRGVMPTRGQVITTRSAVGPSELGTAGGTGNEGFEYWFPRPVKSAAERPIVVLGGGREVVSGHEIYKTDDSIVDSDVGVALRKFLPAVFPRRFNVNQEPEMEWTGIMGYTSSGDPFVGPVVDPTHPDSQRQYAGHFVSAGYSGHGMPRAFSCAEAVVGMIYSELRGEEWTVPEWFPRSYLPFS